MSLKTEHPTPSAMADDAGKVEYVRRSSFCDGVRVERTRWLRLLKSLSETVPAGTMASDALAELAEGLE